MREPDVAREGVVAFLAEGELAAAAEAVVGLAEAVEVRGQVPAAVAVVQVQQAAFADVEEEAGVDAASIPQRKKKRERKRLACLSPLNSMLNFIIVEGWGSVCVGGSLILTPACAGWLRQACRPFDSRALGCRRLHRRKGRSPDPPSCRLSSGTGVA